ncbi:MAG: peptidoglycan-binding domain-containing protein [Pseudomonadota bacterium]
MKPDVPLTMEEAGEVQALLRRLAFNPGPVDGILGPRTTAAIRAYQESRGLEVDGIANQSLLMRLRSDPTSAAQEPSRTP